jgi:uncharacterized protein (DUF58 family)
VPQLESLRKFTVVARTTVELLPPVPLTASTQLTPTRRDVWRFGRNLRAVSDTDCDFGTRQFRPRSRAGSGVYPDTAEVRRYELLLHQDRLRECGCTRRLRGRGTEFESLREYSSDDNYKDINWKASARRGKLISTQYEIERDQT